ncbi:hypothetical protein [Streptomyces sp. NPDC096033]|uniref:hypothetical protein n=1 Tax=Streptomyces sp. NPDC096033 TaxID=3366071 RepID=UPI00380A1BD2
MRSYTVQVHLYGSVAVVTLCAGPGRVGGARSVEGLLRVLAGLGAGVGSLVLDLDCAPFPAPAQALATVHAWAAGQEVAVVTLAPAEGPYGECRPGVPVLRMGLAAGGAWGDEAAPVRRLRRHVAGRALVHQAAGIRQARHQAHPCS